MRYIFKLNIYSILLTFILIVTAVIEFNINVLCNRSWKIIVFFIAWGFVAIQTLKIYSRFPYKVETLHRLVEKGRKKYDFRLFYPYMGSPCMRSVVYFSLCELDHQTDYPQIKRNFNKGLAEDMSSKGRVVRVSYVDGMLSFEAQTDSGEWETLS